MENKNEVSDQDIQKFIQLYAMNDSLFPNPIIVHQDKVEFMFSYLLKKHSNACISKSNFRVVWKGEKRNDRVTYDLLHVNKSLSNVLLGKSVECDQYRFVLIYLEIILEDYDSKKRFSHANILIFDRLNSTLERYEPYGFSQSLYDQITLDKTLFAYANKNGFIYISPYHYCPSNIAFQTVDEQYGGQKHANDPFGFCAFWSIFYADLRLTYPNLSRNKLISFITKNYFSNMKRLIRNYAVFVLSSK